jgi:zinc protease
MSMRTRFLSLLLTGVVALGSAGAALAQTGSGKKQLPPPVGPERPFTFPAHTTAKLENGLTVFVVEDHRQPVVAATVMLPGAGASAHPAKAAGLAAMTAALLRQGTTTRSAQQIAEAIDKVGGSLSAGAGADTTQASVTVVTSALDTGFDLLADIVQRPAFAAEEIERWRRQTLSNLQVAYRDPEYLRDAVGQRVAYGDHPYAYPSDGFPETVRTLSRDAVAQFHRERYTPSGAFLAIAGDITPEAAAALARKHFGSWKASAGGQPPSAQPPAPQRKIVVVDQPDAVQTQFGMIGAGVPRNHPDWLALSVANQILGGSFNSRLNLRLRAKEGLTYGARSAIESNRLAGLWNTTSFTRTEETANAMKVMLEVITDFRKNPATPAELAEATSYLSGVFAIQSETADAVAGRVLTSALHGLPADYWQTYRDRVKKIAAADVSAAVERHVAPDRLSIVAVGNAAGFAKALESLGAVTIVPAAKLDLMQPELVSKQETASGPDAAARGLSLVKAAAEAHGGAARLAEVKDVTTSGNLTVSTPNGDLQGQAKSVILHPDKSRAVLTLPFGELVQSYDGTTASVVPPGQPAMELPPAMLPEMQRGILLSGGIGVIREALNGSAQVAALDAKPVEGVTLDRVSWKKGDLDMVLGFDQKTHRLANVSYRGLTQQGPADSEVRLSDYKPAANGIVVPMRVVTYQNGQKVVEIAITEWLFNTGVTAESFKK